MRLLPQLWVIPSPWREHSNLTRIREPQEAQKLTTSLYHMLRALLVLLSILAFNFFFMLWPILVVALMLVIFWMLASVGVFVGIIVDFAVLLASFASPVVIGI